MAGARRTATLSEKSSRERSGTRYPGPADSLPGRPPARRRQRPQGSAGKEKRRGAHTGRRPGYRKAMIRLAEGQTLEVAEEV